MAVAAPARKTAPAPPPSRTTPPRRKPAGRPAPSRRASTAAPARAPARRAPAPARTPSRAPRRARPRKRANTGQLIPLAVGRTAVAVRQLPDSGVIVRLTRGRAWIGVLGLLLAGIVALNVLTLSFAATAGRIDDEITTLESENSVLQSREAKRFGADRVRHGGAQLGLAMPTTAEPQLLEAGRGDVAAAAARLDAIGAG